MPFFGRQMQLLQERLCFFIRLECVIRVLQGKDRGIPQNLQGLLFQGLLCGEAMKVVLQ